MKRINRELLDQLNLNQRSGSTLHKPTSRDNKSYSKLEAALIEDSIMDGLTTLHDNASDERSEARVESVEKASVNKLPQGGKKQN